MAEPTKAPTSGAKSERQPQLSINFGAIVAASRVYIVEHFIVLVSLVVTLVGGIGLFNAIIDHFMDDQDAFSTFGAVLQFEDLALYIAMAIVALPLFGVFYVRTRKAEREYPKLLASRTRRRLEYVFMFIAFLFVLGYSIGFVYTSTLALVSAESLPGSEGWWQSSLKQWFAIIFISLVGYFVSRLTPGVDKEIK